VPTGIVPLAGDTAIETRVAAVTCNEAEPVTLPCEAVIVIGPPAVVVVARPLEETLATEVLDEDQLAVAVRF
jgi:hypothetical protein